MLFPNAQFSAIDFPEIYIDGNLLLLLKFHQNLQGFLKIYKSNFTLGFNFPVVLRLFQISESSDLIPADHNLESPTFIPDYAAACI